MANELPQVGAEAVLIHDQYDRGIADAIKKADKLDKVFDDMSNKVDVKVSIDDGEIGSARMALDDLSEDAGVKVNVDDAELSTASKLVDDIDAAAPSVKVNADDNEIDQVQDKVDTLIGLQAIDLAINVSGTAISFVESLGRFSGIGGVVELDNALASIEGRTGRMIPDAEKLITDLYTNGWGESRQQIADTVVEASNLKIANEDLAEATLTAFQVQSVSGGDTNEILRTMDSLVKNNLAPDFQTAGDLIVTGLQNGADRGQDLLDTFNEYGTTFGQLRISGPGALALINSGLSAGIDNSDRVADAIRETGIRLATIGTDPNVKAAFDQLDALSDIDLAGLLDAYNSGKISGDEFFNGFFSAFSDANATDPEAASNLATTLIGTQSEDFKVGAISQLTTTWDTTMGELEGRAETAGNTISDTLGTSVDTLLRTLEQGAVDFLSSEQIDLPGKIDAIKTGITEALGVLSSGGSVGEALEIGLNIEGAEDFIMNLERIFGNIGIILLQAIAAIQSLQGVNNQGTLDTVATMAQKQLSFDLQVANPDEVAGLIDQAITRGVTVDNVGTALRTAIEEEIASGDFQDALDLTDAIIASAARNGPEAATTIQAWLQPYIDEINKGIEDAKPKVQQTWWETIGPSKVVDTTKMEDQLKVGQAGKAARGGEWWTQFGGQGGFQQSTIDQWSAMIPPDDVRIKIDDTATAVTDLDTATQTATDNITNNWSDLSVNLSDTTQAVVDQMETTAAKTEEIDGRISTALTDNTVTASFDAVRESADANFPAVIQWLDTTGAKVAAFDTTVAIHLNSVVKQLNDLNFLALQTIANITAAQALGGSGTTNNTTNNVNVTNNNSNGAQTSNSQYQLNNMLGGG